MTYEEYKRLGREDQVRACVNDLALVAARQSDASDVHRETTAIHEILLRYKNLQAIITILGDDELSKEDKALVKKVESILGIERNEGRTPSSPDASKQRA